MEFLQLVSQIFGYLLPIIGTIALIILMVVGVKATKLIKRVENSLTNVDAIVSTANDTIGNLNKTIETANKYVDDFGVTAKTINNVSMTVEAVRFTLEQMVKKFIARWTKEYEQIKNMILSFLEKIENKDRIIADERKESNNTTESEE